MWISSIWYNFRLLWGVFAPREGSIRSKIRSYMRKTIVINVLLILGYYLILQLLVWLAVLLR